MPLPQSAALILRVRLAHMLKIDRGYRARHWHLRWLVMDDVKTSFIGVSAGVCMQVRPR